LRLDQQQIHEPIHALFGLPRDAVKIAIVTLVKTERHMHVKRIDSVRGNVCGREGSERLQS
jgi:hypothetical protein